MDEDALREVNQFLAEWNNTVRSKLEPVAEEAGAYLRAWGDQVSKDLAPLFKALTEAMKEERDV